MVLTIHLDTFEETQRTYDLCALSGLSSYDFADEGENGIVITLETMDDQFALEKIIRFHRRFFEEK